MKLPAVTIIMPVYNVERFLHESIQSVMAQTMADWHLILVDDGSTDTSGRMCDEATQRDKRISVIHRRNGGLSAARNSGLAAATGEYITFLDSDDLLTPDALALMLGAARKTGAWIVCAGFREFHGTPPVISPRPLPSSFEMLSPKATIERILYQKNLDNSIWGKLYDSRLLSTLHMREGIGYEDLDTFYHPLLASPVDAALVKEPIYLYRQHPSSYLHTFSLRRADVLDVTERLTTFMQANHPELLPAARSRQLSANFNIFQLIASNESAIAPEQKKEADEISERCYNKIKELRGLCLRNPSVRYKNKIGIILSYAGGPGLLKLLSRILFK